MNSFTMPHYAGHKEELVKDVHVEDNMILDDLDDALYTTHHNHLHVGKVQIYTGNGKGKTTAALGLAMRACGFNLDVVMLQFVKKLTCSEHIAAQRIGFSIVQADDKLSSQEGVQQIWQRAYCELQRGVDVLILDELGEAMRRGYITRLDVEDLLAHRPSTTELVFTGRGLLPLSDLADLVTEMRDVKHYFNDGISARRGIEY